MRPKKSKLLRKTIRMRSIGSLCTRKLWNNFFKTPSKNTIIFRSIARTCHPFWFSALYSLTSSSFFCCGTAVQISSASAENPPWNMIFTDSMGIGARSFTEMNCGVPCSAIDYIQSDSHGKKRARLCNYLLRIPTSFVVTIKEMLFSKLCYISIQDRRNSKTFDGSLRENGLAFPIRWDHLDLHKPR